LPTGGKVCSLYRFTDEATYTLPKIGLEATNPSNDWKALTSVADARRAVADMRPKNKAKARSLRRTDSKNETQGGNDRLELRTLRKPPTRKASLHAEGATRLEAA
jgi:hypothetical protein